IDRKQTHRLLSIHGLHPQLPVSLRKSLESDGCVSMETVTNAIKECVVRSQHVIGSEFSSGKNFSEIIYIICIFLIGLAAHFFLVFPGRKV
uniref:Uncharacterized protein n=1 Tax=Amphiprion percula TaxID=161767 RepID=A0A3P8SBU4_AMPPE